MRSVKDLTTPELKGMLRQFIHNEIQSMLTISAFGADTLEQFKAPRDILGTGRFLDEPDLQHKYKDNLDQLKMILANTKRFVCPNRVCVMYEDMECQSGLKTVETCSEKRRVHLSLEETIRPSKKQKAAANATRAGDASKLGEKQTEKLDDCLKFLKASGGALQTLKTIIADLGQWIAPAANDRLNELQVLHTAIQALCNDIKLKGECLDFRGFIETISAFKEVFKFDKASIDTQVERSIRSKIAPQYQE